MTREEAIRHIRDVIAENNSIKPNIVIFEQEKEALYMAIEALTNVQNMHKGKWIKKQVFNPELDKYVPFIECSVCGYNPYYGGSEPKFNYCANCGADMRGGEE